MSRIKLFIYWHLMVFGHKLHRWAGAKHGRTLAWSNVGYIKTQVDHGYTERMRKYYGIVGRDIPPFGHTAYWLDKELSGRI